jgi:ABC-type transport system substrate-binding protein
MKRRAWLCFALSSAALRASRPRYGGTLRVQINDGLPALVHLTQEPLPQVAQVQADAARRRWRIILKPNLRQHDGTFVNGQTLLPLVKPLAPDAQWTPVNGSLSLVSEKPLTDFLAALNEVRLPTGPFTAAGKAFEEHWNGRPFLDALETGRPAHPDLYAIPLTAARRFQAGTHRLWSTLPVELFRVQGSPQTPPGVLAALHLAIDRASIVRVLLQGRGEPAGGLAPQWQTGWAFLFSTQPDLPKAQTLLRTKPGPLTLGFAPADSLARSIAERVAVNARDVGLALQTRPGAADLQLNRTAVREFASYPAERAALEESYSVPVAFVPHLYALHQRVRGWEDAHDGRSAELRLDQVWVAE